MRIGPTEIVEAARHRAPMWDAGSGVGKDRGYRGHAKASCSGRRSEYGLGGGVANWGVAQATAGRRGGGRVIHNLRLENWRGKKKKDTRWFVDDERKICK